MPAMPGPDTLARARHRAQDVVGQLRRLLSSRAWACRAWCPAWAQACPCARIGRAGPGLLEQRVVAQTQYQQMLAQGLAMLPSIQPGAIGQLVGQVRERSADLKQKATTRARRPPSRWWP
jgi:hypothetical protein